MVDNMEQEQIFSLIKKYVEEGEGYIKFNNFHLDEISLEKAKLSVELTKDSLNPSGFAHGGLIFTLADSVMGMLARTTGKNVVTINSQIDYLKPGKGTKLYAIAEPIKIGKTIAVYKANIYNDKEELISTVSGTYYFIDYPNNN